VSPPFSQRVRDAVSPLREGNFRLLYISRALSLFGDGLVPVALAFAVLEVTSSPSALGLVLAARWIPTLIFVLVGGVFADRIRRNQVMLAADLASWLIQGAVAVLLIAGEARVWHLLLAAVLYGTASAFFLPAATALVPQTVPNTRLQQANALITLNGESSRILGPVVAGFLVVYAGPGWAFALDSLTFLLSAWFLSRLSVADPDAGLPREEFLHDLRTGWREFRSRTWLWPVSMATGLAGFAGLAPLLVLGPIVSERDLGGASAWALIVGAFGVGSLLASATALFYMPARPLVVGCAAFVGLALPLAFLTGPAPAIVIAGAAVAAGFGVVFFNTLWQTTIQQHVPENVISRVVSIDWSLSLLLLPLGLAVVGPVADAFGTAVTLWSAAACVVVVAVAALSIPDVRRLQRREVSPSESAAESVGGALSA
jgi:predicted MFS family arabinose efflux permease